MDKISNKKLPMDKFLKEREDVLKTWITGEEVDLEDACNYLSKLPSEKNFAKKMEEAKKLGKTLAQPRAGVALLDDHIMLLKYLQEVGGADLLPSTIDSYTRQNRYEEGQRGIEESKKACRSLLNGFPAINHGVKACRKVIESVGLPVQARHGTPDSRLLAEIIHAGGWTSNEGGGISYNVPYAKSVSIEKSLRDWQYCDRLVGFYEEQGIPINREPFGPLTGTLVPPSISNAIGIVEGLLAAEQGVKSITLGYGQCGNLIQDVAALWALESQAEEYIKKSGYNDCLITSVFHQWMGGFPEDEAQAYSIIASGGSIAKLAKATKVIVKTPHEAVGIPTKEANANGIKTTKMAINLLEGQTLPNSKDLYNEVEIIKEETKAILEELYRLGGGDLAQGVIEGFKVGAIDIPFAPSKYNRGIMMPARDNKGAVRYLVPGNLPFNKDIIEFNKNALEERGKFEKREVSFQMTIDDIYAIGKGKLIGRPGEE